MELERSRQATKGCAKAACSLARTSTRLAALTRAWIVQLAASLWPIDPAVSAALRLAMASCLLPALPVSPAALVWAQARPEISASAVQLGKQATVVPVPRAVPALPLARARPQQRTGSSIHALDVLIDDKWFDLSRWRAAHPSGPHWIDGFDGCDATEVMHAFHSDDAMAMLARLPHSNPPPTTAASEPTDLMLAFRRFRVQLIDEGWFERVWWREAATLAPCLLLYVVGTVLARRRSALATVLLALGSTSAG